MKNPAGTSFDDFLNEQLRDHEIKAEYDALTPRYELIKAIIAARTEQGITQTELARRVGTKQNNISRFESGAHMPTLDFAGKVAAALGKELHISLR
jgi:ribosome-binding protein aMBF1 (putative translation factor)